MRLLSEVLPIVQGATMLRRFRRDDAVAFHSYRSDPKLALFQGWTVMSQEESDSFVEAMADAATLIPGGWVQLAVAARDTEELLGDVGVFLEADLQEAEVGFTLASRHQGHGHAGRAVTAAVQLVLDTVPVRLVRATTDARNSASINVLERAGFTKVSETRVVFKGEACTELTYVRRREVTALR